MAATPITAVVPPAIHSNAFPTAVQLLPQAAPSPIFGPFYQLRSQWIGFPPVNSCACRPWISVPESCPTMR